MANARASQAYVLAAAQEPAPFVRASQAFTQVAVETTMDARVTQAFVLVAVRGRPYDPTIRAWTFTLDGHDFYVLRLGQEETLVYDTHAEQWYLWGSGETDLWAVMDGINWQGGHGWSGAFGSNVVVGSDTNGALFFLDPDGSIDDNAYVGADEPEPYRREAMAQYIMRGYDQVPCWGVQLLGSIGSVDNETLTDVALSVSDDRGDTYLDCGTIAVTPDAYMTRVEWRSLGSMIAPGRLFKIVDYGALHRIDSLEMPD